MKHPLSIALAFATALSATAHAADIDFYGKANLSLEYVSEGDEDFTELNSNASRVGFKGEEVISETLSAVYQLEYETQHDDADTFGQRNIFLGLKGSFGSLLAGHFDTAFKASQKSVDLFNDLPGDIKNVIVASELRKSNSVMYISPEFASGIQLYADYINSESEEIDPSLSLAATYTRGGLYLALAADMDMFTSSNELYDAVRFVTQYSMDRFQFGLLVEEFSPEVGDSETGYMGSVQYALNDKVALKGQAGVSDIKTEGGKTFSLGADYKLSKTAKTFAFYTNNSADDDTVFDDSYLGVGLEVKF